MSPLPQRKKSPEEIERLRDDLGIRRNRDAAPPPSGRPPVAPAVATAEQIARDRQAEALRRARLEKRAARSLRRAEWEAPLAPPPASRSERSGQPSAIPMRRHSSAELMEIRRRETLSQLASPDTPNLFPRPASPLVVTPGYLCALFGAACHFWPIPLAATAATGTSALLVAGWIFLFRKPSSHHAALISIIAMLALTFASLHYFPHLRHAS